MAIDLDKMSKEELTALIKDAEKALKTVSRLMNFLAVAAKKAQKALQNMPTRQTRAKPGPERAANPIGSTPLWTQANRWTI